MLNIMVMNCDDVFVEYEWNSKEDFLKEMESDNESIPMLDDPVITMDIDSVSFSEEDCRDQGVFTVNDLVTWCKENRN